MKNVGAKKNITKKTPILIIGLGSIGRRHYANLQSLGYREITVYDIDASKGATHDVRSITSLDDSTLRQHPVVFVCNPSHQHVATALRAIKAGCNVFVEKPLSLSDKDLKPLSEALKKNRNAFMVACNYRFHQGYIALKKKLKSGTYGRPLVASAALCYHLPTARPGVDYRKTYAVSRSSGGGALLDSGSHVIDYLIDLFGVPKEVKATLATKTLPIDADDFASLDIVLSSGVNAHVTLDYFSLPRRNYLEVQCERGHLRWDIAHQTLVTTDSDGKSVTKRLYAGKSATEAVNDMFLQEAKYFMSLVGGRGPSISDIDHASLVVKTLARSASSAKR